MITIETSSDLINKIADKGVTLNLKDLNLNIDSSPHAGYVFKCGSQSLLTTINTNEDIIPIKGKMCATGISPRSAEQALYMHYLLNRDIPLVVATGVAGSGKTLLAVAVAIETALNGRGPQKRIFMCKSLSEIGYHRVGIMPGDLQEKTLPYMESFKEAMRSSLGVEVDSTIERYVTRDRIIMAPPNMLRGVTINDAIVIIDEAQNLSKYELRAIGTRIGATSRLFLLGDHTQSDERHAGEGLSTLLTSKDIKQSPLCTTIHLLRNERSELSALLDKALF